MSLIMKGKVSSNDFELPKAGLCLAYCLTAYDMGIQKSNFKGHEGEPIHKVALIFELNQKFTKGELAGKPMVYYQDYTFSVSEKATLVKHLEMWRGSNYERTIDANGETTLWKNKAKGEELDLINCQGQKAVLSITHKISAKGNSYALIAGINPPDVNNFNFVRTIDLGYVPPKLIKHVEDNKCFLSIEEQDIHDFSDDDNVAF